MCRCVSYKCFMCGLLSQYRALSLHGSSSCPCIAVCGALRRVEEESSDIYCHGRLLHTVQMADMFDDSKHFVDMSLRYDPSIVIANFEIMMVETDDKPTLIDVQNFLEKNFNAPSVEFVDWVPQNWNENPKFISEIKDKGLSEWMRHLHKMWRSLGREVRGMVHLYPERHSLIYVPNPTIVPGGRFREFYYWDSYWTIKGLLLSEMYKTVRGMLENFLTMIKRYGFVPNGGRIYYSERSQPPLLIPMIHEYLEATGDNTFLSANIDYIEKEYLFWVNNRSIEVNKDDKMYTMYRYHVDIDGPRPESYKEDYNLAHKLSNDEAVIRKLYVELKSAAESGWDFSSRWFVDDDGTIGSLKDLRTSEILPVDLNSLMYMNAMRLSSFYGRLDMTEKFNYYAKEGRKLREAIDAVFWVEEEGCWFDYIPSANKHNLRFYASNLFPAWVNASTPLETEKVIEYLLKNKLTTYPSGVPTSTVDSGEQWDYPNGWPPMQHVIVESLENLGTNRSRKMAYELAQSWVNTNYRSYVSTGHMFEKYNVLKSGDPGHGGEYEVQLGFGWTNAVVMDLVYRYRDRITSNSATSVSGAHTRHLVVVCLTAILISVSCLFFSF